MLCLYLLYKMNDKIEVMGAPVVYTNQNLPPHNPLNRPEISYKKPILFLTLYILGTMIILFGANNVPVKKGIFVLGFSLFYFSFILKKTVIWCVHLYQNKASDATRLRCVFEPSCSEYMILAINKYGTIRGIIKGVKRLLRCHPPNGGRDYP